MEKHSLHPTIGILYPGEMGARLGELLLAQGHRVVTTTEGRSRRTRRLSGHAGIESLDTLSQVAMVADVVISIVRPAAASEVASSFQQAVANRTDRVIYVEANAVSPMTVRAIADSFSHPNLHFVDAAIHGLAAQLPEGGMLYLSGTTGKEIRRLFSPALRVEILDAEPGSASGLKMLIGGLNKGLVSLFLEMTRLSCELGSLDKLLSVYRASYPGVMEIVDRLLPTFPLHAKRRAEEMQELQETMTQFGVDAWMTKGVREVITELAAQELEIVETLPATAAVESLVEQYHQQLVFQQDTSPHPFEPAFYEPAVDKVGSILRT